MINLLAPVLSLAFLLAVIYLVKIKRLREEYSLLWIALGVGFILLAFFPSLIDFFASIANIYYAPALLFLIWLAFITLILLNYAIVISKLKDYTKTLTQENALLRYEVEKLKSKESRQDTIK